MHRYDRRAWILAASLAVLAGFVDAVGFLRLGGFFVSFMSGNSTRLGVAVGVGDAAAAGIAVSLLLLFVAGVVAGALVGRERFRWRRPAVLAVVASTLLLSAILVQVGLSRWAVAPCAFAMGALNALFQKDGEVTVGVTYMTGALVRMGHRIAAALRGGPVWAFLPYLMLWCGLAVGAILGTAAFGLAPAGALWLATAAAAMLALILFLIDRRQPSP